MSTSTSTRSNSTTVPAPVPRPNITCKIDPDILNENSLQDMNDIGLSFFASVCGKNRGAFVLDPPDGNTYGWYVYVFIQIQNSESLVFFFPLSNPAAFFDSFFLLYFHLYLFLSFL